MNQSTLETILWAVGEVTTFLAAAGAAFWLSLRADTNRKKFNRAVMVLAVYSAVVTIGYVAWIGVSNYTALGAIYWGILIGAFHFMLMAVIIVGVLWLTLLR